MLDNIWVLVQAPVLNLQLLVDGVFIGAIFVLIAYGLGLVWGVMNVKNLAQGDFVIMGGYIAWTLSNPRYMGDYAVHPILGLPVAIAFMLIAGCRVYGCVQFGPSRTRCVWLATSVR